MRSTVKVLVILVVTAPFAFALTFVTFPLWRWIDLNTPIEAFGHSGPADWCFYVTYAVLLVAILGTYACVGRKREKGHA